MNTRLRILCEQEYIGRRYDKSYKLQARFATYYLLAKGIEVLRQDPSDFRPTVLRSIQRSASASDRFVRHCLNIFSLYCLLKERHDDRFKFFTRSYLQGYDYFPRPLPDAYITCQEESGKTYRQYIVEYFDDTLPQQAMQQRIKLLADHADSGEWTTEAAYPAILLLCHTARLQRKVQKWADKAAEESWTNELTITATTPDSLSI